MTENNGMNFLILVAVWDKMRAETYFPLPSLESLDLKAYKMAYKQAKRKVYVPPVLRVLCKKLGIKCLN